jgi:hypothetical protein
MPDEARARTLKEFVVALDTLPRSVLEGHARRGDYSRWLRDVFGDYPLAFEVGAAEERCRDERDPAAVSSIASAVRGRYDLTPGVETPCVRTRSDVAPRERGGLEHRG